MPPAKRSAPTTDPHILLKRRQERQKANEKLQLRLDEQGVRRCEVENDLSFSDIPQVLLINQKNYYTEYLKKDENYMIVRNLKERRDKEKEKEDEDGKVVIIHPGSESLKIGFANAVDPFVVPNLVGHLRRDAKIVLNDEERVPLRDNIDGEWKLKDEEWLARRGKVVDSFKERLKYYKRRVLPNTNESCFNFNKKQEATVTVEEDMEGLIRGKKWIAEKNRDYVYGDEVLNLRDEGEWIIRSPFDFSVESDGFSKEYRSREEVLGDCELLLKSALQNQLEIKDLKELKEFKVVLVLPSIYSKDYVETMLQMLLCRFEFSAASVLQEGVAAAYGLGMSSGCIIDMGAKCMKICCIDEGVVNEGAVVLPYGGDDILKFFTESLIAQQFPWHEVDLRLKRHYRVMEKVFWDLGTFDETKADGFAVGSVAITESKKRVKKYQFKCCDEGMVCPMGVFYPEVFGKETALDKAIIDCVGACSEDKVGKMFANIAVVGGCSALGGIEKMIADRISMIAGEVEMDVSTSQEIAGGVVMWKGGSVYGRLRAAWDMGVSREEWGVLGGRCIGQMLVNYDNE